MNKFFTKYFKIFIGSIFSFVGLCFLLVGIYIIFTNNEFYKHASKTTATIVDIETYYSNNYSNNNHSNRRHEVHIEYDVNGKVYEKLLNYYSSTMYKGKVIDIYYNSDNPNQFSTPENKFINFIFIIIGTVFILVGIPFILSFIKNNIRIKKLLEKDKFVYAKIIDLKQDIRISINGRHPYYIICSDINRSESIYESGIISNYYNVTIGDTIKVYIDEKNRKNYFVDTRSL